MANGPGPSRWGIDSATLHGLTVCGLAGLAVGVTGAVMVVGLVRNGSLPDLPAGWWTVVGLLVSYVTVRATLPPAGGASGS